MSEKIICTKSKITTIADALRERTNTTTNYTLDTIGSTIPNIGNKNTIMITNCTPGETLTLIKDSYTDTTIADSLGVAEFTVYDIGEYNIFNSSSQHTEVLITNIITSKLSRLPSSYQEVEYIESTGTQYINTDFYYDGIDDKQLRMMWKPTTSMGSKSISGYEQSGIAMRWFFTNYGQAGNNAQYMLYADYNNSSQSILQSIGTKYDATFTAKNGTLTVNEVLTGQSYSHTYTSTTTSFPNNKLRLFCNSPSQVSSIQLYLAQMWSEGELKYDFVPCYRVSDNKPGMYDLVTNTFYINAGTGEFGIGPEV